MKQIDVWHTVADMLARDGGQETIANNLPHGSGIDGKWHYSENSSHWLFHNFYHCMDDNGMYCGYADFTIKVKKSFPVRGEWWTLQFNGDNSQYLNKKHYLRDYLEDTIQYDFEGFHGHTLRGDK